jgi:alpha-L-rhamnosidase
VGEITFGILINTLHEQGLDDLVLRTISRTDVPGYGMQLARGVTALAETWSAERQAVGEGSNNHFMLGMIEDWMHEHVAGLAQSPDSAGWRRALVSPTFVSGVAAAASVHDSPVGRYEVSWQRTDADDIRVEVTVPSDGTSLVRIAGIPEHEIGPGAHTFLVAIVEPVLDLEPMNHHD